MTFVVRCYCNDCTGQDSMGCNDGASWLLWDDERNAPAAYETTDAASKAGHDATDATGPWEFIVLDERSEVVYQSNPDGGLL